MADVLVVCGGDSSERLVSLASAEAVANGLKKAGHRVRKLDTAHPEQILDLSTPLFDGVVSELSTESLRELSISPTGWLKLGETIINSGCDCVFPILHGGFGEDGHIQAFFELLEVPYLGSNVLASQISMDKWLSKEIAHQAGAPVPRGLIIRSSEDIDSTLTESRELGWPLVVKPFDGGSTVDLFIVDNETDFLEAINMLLKKSEIPLVEEFVPGRELTVTVIDGKAYPMVEIKPDEGFYDFKRKYTKGYTNYICPADLDKHITREIQNLSVMLYNANGCRDFARVDWRITPEGKYYYLEINTLPGMTDLSLVPMAAKAEGLSFSALMDYFVQMVMTRVKLD